MAHKIDRRLQGNNERVDIWWTLDTTGAASVDMEMYGTIMHVITATGLAVGAPDGFTPADTSCDFRVQLLDNDGQTVDMLQTYLSECPSTDTTVYHPRPEASTSFDIGIDVCGRYLLTISDGGGGAADVDGCGVVRLYVRH